MCPYMSTTGSAYGEPILGRTPDRKQSGKEEQRHETRNSGNPKLWFFSMSVLQTYRHVWDQSDALMPLGNASGWRLDRTINLQPMRAVERTM